MGRVSEDEYRFNQKHKVFNFWLKTNTFSKSQDRV